MLPVLDRHHMILVVLEPDFLDVVEPGTRLRGRPTVRKERMRMPSSTLACSKMEVGRLPTRVLELAGTFRPEQK